MTRYAFTKKAASQGTKAKLHVLTKENKARCNPKIDIEFRYTYSREKILLLDVCKICLNCELHQSKQAGDGDYYDSENYHALQYARGVRDPDEESDEQAGEP